MQSPKNNLPQAKKGEDIATLYLSRKGYLIIQRNFRSRTGEIDIVALDKNTLVFVEVKSRWTEMYGDPKEAVTPKKIRSIERTADYFKLLNPETSDLMRIDVVAINFINEKLEIEHLENVTG